MAIGQPPAQLGFAFAIAERRRMAMPLEFIGASLFSALNRAATAKHYAKMTELLRMNGYRVLYKGRVLTQAHADVWLAIIELFKRQQRTTPHAAIEFHAGQVLRVLGKVANARRRHELNELITDMVACAVQIVQPGIGKTWVGPMVFGEIERNEITGETRYRVVLHPVLCEAYDRGFTSFEWMERKSIGKNELALWLHQYLLAFPEPVPVTELQEHSWQTSAPARVFRHRLKHAAGLLQGLGLIERWGFDREGRFIVKRSAAE
jgi:hypothetical protein